MDDVRLAYSRWSTAYVEALGSLDAVDPSDLAFIDRHLTTGPALDLGCGPGHLTGHLHGRGLEVLGVDLVPEFIAHARSTYPDVPFVVGSLLEVDVRDVAGVLAWFSLIHLDDLDAALRQVRRLLRDEGILVAGFFVGPVHETFEHRVLAAHRYPEGELIDRFAQAGLVVVDQEHRIQEGNQRPYVALAARAG